MFCQSIVWTIIHSNSGLQKLGGNIFEIGEIFACSQQSAGNLATTTGIGI
jgi:hypothetical protein